MKNKKPFQAIWLTGQPGSGKTTLANLLFYHLKENSPNKSFFNIDGDDLRDLFQNKDYSREGREKNIRVIMMDCLEKYLILIGVLALMVLMI